MSETKSIFDILNDPDDIENVVLDDDDGNETEFEQIATIDLDGEMYCILCPVEDGAASDEGWVFRLAAEDDKELLELVDNEETIDKVFEKYNELCED